MTELATKLTAALLLQHGELALRDIKALPFIASDRHALAVANRLLETFDVDIVQRQGWLSAGTSDPDMVLVLKTPVILPSALGRTSKVSPAAMGKTGVQRTPRKTVPSAAPTEALSGA